ncbi:MULTISPECIES: hypothetical protein [unclassified Mesorhizobium]|uniref:hypothetical protein n=1 Tax=unclassified Mesorhizobium TaxID=325217 RepID=UPI00333D84EA
MRDLRTVQPSGFDKGPVQPKPTSESDIVAAHQCGAAEALYGGHDSRQHGGLPGQLPPGAEDGAGGPVAD